MNLSSSGELLQHRGGVSRPSYGNLGADMFPSTRTTNEVNQAKKANQAWSLEELHGSESEDEPDSDPKAERRKQQQRLKQQAEEQGRSERKHRQASKKPGKPQGGPLKRIEE